MASLYKQRKRRPDGTVQELPIWWLKYYQNGRAIRVSTETKNLAAAKRFRDARVGDVQRGIPTGPKMGRITFEEAKEDLLTEYRTNNRRSYDFVERRINVGLEPAFRGQRLVDITTDKVRKYIANRQKAGAENSTINRELSALKRMFTLAVQAAKLHSRPYIPMLQERNARKGFFEQEQFEAVRGRLSDVLRDLLTVAYYTGWRTRSELLPLQWRQVDRRAGILRLEPNTTKNREGREFHYLPIEDLRLAIESRWQAHQKLAGEGVFCPWVFERKGKPVKNCYRAWRTACKEAGCVGKIPHDFRRTAVRNLVRAGVPEKVAMTMTGHKTRAVFDRYNIVSDADLRVASEKLGNMGRLSGIPASTAPEVRKQTA